MAAALLLSSAFTIRSNTRAKEMGDKPDREKDSKAEERKAGGDREDNRFGQRAQIRAP